MTRFRITFSDFTEGEYENEKDAVDAILEAHAENVGVEEVRDADTENLYSCVWSVFLQKEE